MKHSIKQFACFTTFAISTGAQNFLESTKSETTNYSIIPSKPTKSDKYKKILLIRSKNQIRKLRNPEFCEFSVNDYCPWFLVRKAIWCVELTHFWIFMQPIPIFFSKYKTETTKTGQSQLLANKWILRKIRKLDTYQIVFLMRNQGRYYLTNQIIWDEKTTTITNKQTSYY